MIILNLEDLLSKREKTLYWLASPEGADVEYSTLWRLKEGRAKSISFELLNKLCTSLECTPGDLLDFTAGGPAIQRTPSKKPRKPKPPQKKILFKE